jgi:hypothetical protein
VGVFSDITKAKESQEKLDHLAHHDPLTALPNRLLFADRLQHALQRATRDKSNWRCCSSIWTVSNTSTIRWATTSATSCSSKSPRRCRRATTQRRYAGAPGWRRIHRAAGDIDNQYGASQVAGKTGADVRAAFRGGRPRTVRPAAWASACSPMMPPT